ncbi:MAG: 4-(cytidine 5'-diphospho)-2-C-methyl-D-erythritol kinase [Hyphomonadaceae bacterium]
MSVRVFAPAKINLTLEVAPVAANGRHPLQSIVAFADVGDWIEAEAAPALSIELSGPFAAALCGEADNLVLRAAHALAEAYGVRAGAQMRLEKNLPVASGIGGGSSDAAAALKALRSLWALDIPDSGLMRLAASLGGDVPVCVHAGAALMSGEGDRVAPLTLPPLDAVLVNPGFAVSTGAVFQQFDAMQLGATLTPIDIAATTDRDALLALIAARGNHLQPAAATVAPGLREVADALDASAHTRLSGLSGSGATMFALTHGAADAQALAQALQSVFPRWWVAACRLG